MHHVPPARLGELLGRIAAAEGDAGGYLSSHPALRERVEAAAQTR
jgi:hypothetical protein